MGDDDWVSPEMCERSFLCLSLGGWLSWSFGRYGFLRDALSNSDIAPFVKLGPLSKDTIDKVVMFDRHGDRLTVSIIDALRLVSLEQGHVALSEAVVTLLKNSDQLKKQVAELKQSCGRWGYNCKDLLEVINAAIISIDKTKRFVRSKEAAEIKSSLEERYACMSNVVEKHACDDIKIN